jgi:hypothetical protein
MTRYANLNGDSAVLAYEMDSDSIIVEFNDSTEYIYNYSSAGISNIEQMKNLAASGRGLCRLITTVLKDQYAKKLR